MLSFGASSTGSTLTLRRHFDDYHGHHSPGDLAVVVFVGKDSCAREVLTVKWYGGMSDGKKSTTFPADFE